MVGFWVMVGAAVIVGGLAQSWKGRTGAGWGFITLLLGALGFVFIYMIMEMGNAWRLVDSRSLGPLNLSAVAAVTVVLPVMLLIVASLPNLKARRAAALAAASGAPGAGGQAGGGDSRPCPHCAETIKRAAVVCRFCGRDVPA